MPLNLDKLRPVTGEDRWVDYDDESQCWGVFGTESGFCYSLHSDKESANETLKEWEKNKTFPRNAFR